MSRPAAAAGSRARDFWIQRLPIVLLAWGAVLRVEQFAARRSLWLDEATLAINFVDRPFSQLAEPLGNSQGAPVGFLFVERAAVALLGNNEYALRLFPLACGVASLFVFLRIARRLLPGPAVAVAMGLFAFAPFLVYYSSEAKQYSVDVLVALGVTDLTLRLLDRERLTGRDAVALGAAGAAAVWFSHSAALVLAAAGLILLIARARRARRDVALLAAAGGAWLASVAVAYAVSLRDLTADQTLLEYWRGAFLPSPFGVGRTVRWLAATGHRFVLDPGGFRPSILAIALGVLGAIALGRRNGLAKVAVLAMPALALLGAAAAGVYPAGGRLALFLVPAALVFIAASVTVDPGRLRLAGTALVGAALIVAAVAPVGNSVGYLRRPITRNETRLAFEFVEAEWLDGDALYIHHGANAAYRYYRPQLGLPVARVFRGSSRAPCDDRVELAELRAPRRVWLVFGHRFEGAPDNERDIVASHVAVVARQLGAFAPPGAAAYLFDPAAEPDDPSGSRVLRVPELSCVQLASS